MQIKLVTFGIWELIAILAIVLLIFGAGKLPQLGDSLGKGIRNFRRAFREEPRDVESEARRLEKGEYPDALPPRSGAAAQSERERSKPPVQRE